MLKFKENTYRVQGVIEECLSDNKYRVRLDDEKLVLGYSSGKIIKNHIKLIPQDIVIIELNPFNLEKGRIVYRK